MTEHRNLKDATTWGTQSSTTNAFGGGQHHDRTQKLEGCYNMRHTIINRARFWGNHYQAKIQDMQQRITSSTCMMLKSGSLAETPKSTSRSLQTRHAAALYVVDMYDVKSAHWPRRQSLQTRKTVGSKWFYMGTIEFPFFTKTSNSFSNSSCWSVKGSASCTSGAH